MKRRTISAICCFALLAACASSKGPGGDGGDAAPVSELRVADARVDGGSPDLPGGPEDVQPVPDTVALADLTRMPEAVEVAADLLPEEEVSLVLPDLPADAEPEDCPGLGAGPVSGQLYFDGDQSSQSIYAQGFYAKYDQPIPGWEVSILAHESKKSTLSCPNGRFHLGKAGPGNYVLDVKRPKQAQCTSNNLPRRFPKAVKAGHVTIVTIGDSVPNVGPKPLFSTRLATLVDEVADVTNLNLAVSGTTTKHWLPGSYYFESVLEPALPSADVVVISIGGNDVMGYIGGSMGSPYDMLKKVDGLDAFTTELHNNVALIINEIKARYEDVDVVFCLYVNYARSDYWSNMAGPYKSLFVAAGHNALVKARGLLAEMGNVLIADIFGALGDAPVEPYLSDSVHLSAAGHELYAHQIFLALGGVIVDEDQTPQERLFGFSW